MRLLIQRVAEASVIIDNKTYSNIKNGLLVFVGIEEKDSKSDINYLANKTINLNSCI